MGAQQSSGSNDDDCRPCFAFPSVFRRRDNSNDLLGSPLPDTPVSRRKRREFSSRYDGLEKEVSAFSQTAFYALNTNGSQAADVHEGLVRDRFQRQRLLVSA